MAFKKQCDIETVIPFDGIVVYDKDDIRWWMGTTEDGLRAFINKYIDKNVGLADFRIFRAGEYIETVAQYASREMSE